MDEVATKTVAGTKSELTLRSSISPDTLRAAIADALAKATAGAAEAMREDTKQPHTCPGDCVLRYIVKYSQPQERNETTTTINISREFEGLYVSIDAGKITTATVWLTWTLYRACLKPGDVGTVTTPPPQPPRKTVDQFGTPVSVQCPSYAFATGVATVREYWDDQISWGGEASTQTVLRHIADLKATVISKLYEQAAGEAAAAWRAFGQCPVDCSESSTALYFDLVEIKQASNYMEAGWIGYYDRYWVIGTMRWHAVRKCS